MHATETRVEGRAGSRAGQHILTVKGPITVATVPVFHEAVKAATGSALIVDLNEVPYIDSAAIGALVQAHVTCARNNRKLALVGLGHRVRAVLKISSVDILFTTYPTLAEAEAALG